MRSSERVGALRVAAVVAACCVAACAGRHETATPMDIVQLRIRADAYRIVGEGAGVDCVKRYLGMVQLRAPSAAEAERQALARAGGTFLLDKRAYSGFERNWLVVSNRCHYVEGTGVEFPPPAGATGGPR